MQPSPEPLHEERDKGEAASGRPWPYVIGTVALAGAGAAAYFTLRPADDVSVGPRGSTLADTLTP